MKLFVCLHNQLGAISRLRYLSESAPHLLSLLVSESIFQLPLPPLDFIYLFRRLGAGGGLLCLGGPGSGRLPGEWPLLPGFCVDQDPGKARSPPPLTPAAGGWARPETTELPFCLDVLPASSSQSQPQPPVRGRGGRRPTRGVHQPFSRSGGPETRDAIRI